MIPTEIQNVFENHREDDYNLHILGIDFRTEHLIIEFRFDIILQSSEKEIQQWRITSIGAVKNRLTLEWTDRMSIEGDHPLLWPFTDIQCELYYSGTCTNIQKLFYDLYQIHRDLYTDYEAFTINFEQMSRSIVPFQFQNGMLASGSKQLMQLYGDCLINNGLDYSIINESAPLVSDLFGKVAGGLKLLLFGNGYVIAENFIFEKMA